MAVHLTAIVETYFKDTDYQDSSRRVIARREASIAVLKRIVTQFVERSTDLKTFREQLDEDFFLSV